MVTINLHKDGKVSCRCMVNVSLLISVRLCANYVYNIITRVYILDNHWICIESKI